LLAFFHRQLEPVPFHWSCFDDDSFSRFGFSFFFGLSRSYYRFLFFLPGSSSEKDQEFLVWHPQVPSLTWGLDESHFFSFLFPLKSCELSFPFCVPALVLLLGSRLHFHKPLGLPGGCGTPFSSRLLFLRVFFLLRVFDEYAFLRPRMKEG